METLHICFVSGEDLPWRIQSYAKMTESANRKGLLITNYKLVYSFQCSSSSDCRWVKESYELKVSRYGHVMLKVPASLVEDC